jgi:trans-aconitate methyltransferase
MTQRTQSQAMTEGHNEPASVDTSVPNVARIYDYLLGGKDNYAIDRQAAEELLEAVPDAAIAARQNRDFLRRAVRFLARDCGVHQFIDMGTGLPTRGNVHEVAQQFMPGARVLYVDNDPVVLTHAQALLANNATTVVIGRDVRDPDEILRHPALQALIDLSKPVAILLVAVLHFVSDADGAYAIVERLKEAIAPGSYLAISHVTGDGVPAEAVEKARELYENSTAPGVARTHAEVTRFFDGLELVAPGVVNVSSWRASFPARKSVRTIFYAGVGHKLPRKDAAQ